MQPADFCEKCGKIVDPSSQLCLACSTQSAAASTSLTEERTKPNVSPLLLILLFCMIFLVVLSILLMSNTTNVIKQQLAALKQGDIHKAYTFTSQEFQASTSLDHFKEFIQKHPILAQSANTSFADKKIEHDQSVVFSQLKTDNGLTENVRFMLVKEKGAWKVLAIKMETNSAPALTQNNTTHIFEDKKLNLAISYPNNWEYTKPNASSVMFNGQRGTSSYDVTVSIEMISLKKSGIHYKDPQAGLIHLQQQLKSSTNDVIIVREDTLELPLNLKQYKGMYFIATYTNQGIAMKKLQCLLIGPNQTAYTWEYTAPAAQFEANLSNAKKMYDSWVIH